MPLITVGIPVYNAMPYLPEALESVLAQSYGDFEIVVINDGSTDASSEYLNSVQDRRLRVVSQSNIGLTGTLNRMLVEANTPWLVRMDADDFAYPNRIARTVEYIRRYPNAGMFYSLADYYPKGTVGQFRTTKGTPSEIRDIVLSGRLPAICHPTVTLNIQRVLNAGGYRFDLYIEDIDLWWRLALRDDIRFIPEVTMGCRTNLKSVSSTNLKSQMLNTLYVQYLLLSNLRNLIPLRYDQVCVPLAFLVDERGLEFKEHIREFNIAMGQREHTKALAQCVRAWAASPTAFSRRVIDEIFGRRSISLGEAPEIFNSNQLLWAAALTASNESETTREAMSDCA